MTEKETLNVILVAGFGDNASMFEPLLNTPLANEVNLHLLNFPGFGADASTEPTTLTSLAEFLSEQANQRNASVIVAHSVASIVASIAATLENPVERIISLEGNLTEEDAYFSGTAADFDYPDAFLPHFIARLQVMAQQNPILERYIQQVHTADPLSLWQLGCDAKQFSQTNHPGEFLNSAAKVTYLYNADNCPKTSMAWLQQSTMHRVALPEASHWPSVDKPSLLSDIMRQVLSQY